ncbi:MAG: RNA polymerase-associated protein RapA [Lentisphaeraceae bacterium]|nr:RNA polymerase-associated protein RapA [Lentisphaeraceae bacterium]
MMFLAGQRWISEAEPELGLGTILKTTTREVHIFFGASQTTRVYSPESAPLKRAVFRVGDKVTDKQDVEFKVSDVEEENGLFYYFNQQERVIETELADNLSFSEPHDKLLKQHLDDHRLFNLRYQSYEHQNRIKSSSVYGYSGARIDLIPHQLYVASQVTSRKNPRVLLSDEVGLGKTIEAGLVLHRKILTGAVTRVLVIVPESLVHQWFVEMFRKFNLWFTIMDEERCKAVTQFDESVNPFLQDQLVIASQELLLEKPEWGMRAVQGEWDLTVIDEAHHIEWHPEKSSPEYELASGICNGSKGVLLLTATPEQLGEESHFARLRLLDPDKFHDLQKFLNEVEDDRQTAAAARSLMSGKKVSASEKKLLKEVLEGEAKLAEWLKEPEKNRDSILDALVDRHGPGRMIFRNTRRIMKNFPERKLQIHKFSLPQSYKEYLSDAVLESLQDLKEFVDTHAIREKFSNDPRIEWLVNFLQKNNDEKVLFICSTREKAEKIEAAFQSLSGRKTVLFHEGMSLMQRDKNAVYFADENGAQIMFCSEIGSEGRNFQFAHNLILWDLPIQPGLLEQRIGRLDRIGQTETVKIHVPFFEETSQEALLRFYHEGLNAFEQSLQGEVVFREIMETEFLELLINKEFSGSKYQAFLKELAIKSEAVRSKILEGRDALLEYNSFREDKATYLVNEIAEKDEDHQLETYLEDAFDYFGILHEEMSPAIWKIAPGPNMITDALPAILPEGQMMSLRRQKALHDEQMMFLNWEHPLVGGMIDQLLGSEKGNASFALYKDEDSRTLLLETVFVLESTAAPDLQVFRYLPATPIRLVMNHKMEDLTAEFPFEDLIEELEDGEPHKVLDVPQVVDQLIPAMLETSREQVEGIKEQILAESIKKMQITEEEGIQRLKELAKINPAVSAEEIQILENQKNKLTEALSRSTLRLDAVRFIWKGSETYFG